MFPAWCMSANVIFQICLFPRVSFCLFQKHGKTRAVSFYASEDLEHCQFCRLVKIHTENWSPSQIIYLFRDPKINPPHITDDNDEEDAEDDFGFNMRRVEESRPASRAVKRPTFLSQLFYKPIIIIISAVFAIVSANDNR